MIAQQSKCRTKYYDDSRLRGPQDAVQGVSLLREELRDSGNPAEAGQDLVLEVRDDGRGISPEESDGAKSLGLLGMRERARLHGGKLEIQRSPGKGTQVRVSVLVGPPEYCGGTSLA